MNNTEDENRDDILAQARYWATEMVYCIMGHISIHRLSTAVHNLTTLPITDGDLQIATTHAVQTYRNEEIRNLTVAFSLAKDAYQDFHKKNVQEVRGLLSNTQQEKRQKIIDQTNKQKTLSEIISIEKKDTMAHRQTLLDNIIRISTDGRSALNCFAQFLCAYHPLNHSQSRYIKAIALSSFSTLQIQAKGNIENNLIHLWDLEKQILSLKENDPTIDDISAITTLRTSQNVNIAYKWNLWSKAQEATTPFRSSKPDNIDTDIATDYLKQLGFPDP